MNTKSELNFLNKRVSHIPVIFDIDKLDKTTQERFNILKAHILKSHKIVTKQFHIQLKNNILISNQNGIINKSDNISDYIINDTIALILNKYKILKIEE